MPLKVRPMIDPAKPRLAGRVFLSASIPDPSRWSGYFGALAITDAVVAAVRAVLTEGAGLVTAAHPTIAPLILYVAREFPEIPERPSAVIVYQSKLFDDVLPRETYELAEGGLAELRWTEATPGDSPEPFHWGQSLRILRETMLKKTDPVAALFVGGMEGILEEFNLFKQFYPQRPAYAIHRPGGVAATLEGAHAVEGQEELEAQGSYSALFRKIVRDIRELTI